MPYVNLNAGSSALSLPWTVSGTVNVGDVVCVSAPNTIMRADADNAEARPPIGICVLRSGSGAQVALNGDIASGLAGLTVGTTYWLGTTPGSLVSTKPETFAYVIGTATSATELFLNSSQADLAGGGGGGITAFGISSSDLTVTNSPITSSGLIGLSLNTVAVSKGGLGLTSTSEGATPYATSSSAYTSQAVMRTLKNRIINGDMRVSQRYGDYWVNKNNWSVDRWAFNATGTAAISAARTTVAPTGFANSLGFYVNTGVTPAAAEWSGFYTNLEGLSIVDWAWGTASAKTVTLSFWVRASVVGTYGVRVGNYAGTWFRSGTYTINAANTWERKSIVYTGSTGGVWVNTNAGALGVFFDLGSGSNYQGTINTWAASGSTTVAGRANFTGTTGASFYITGVQLEQSAMATDFEQRPLSIEIPLCYRYYQAIGYNQMVGWGRRSSSFNRSTCWVPNVCGTMRTIPTAGLYGGSFTVLPWTTPGAANSGWGVVSYKYGTNSITLDANHTYSIPSSGQICVLYCGADSYLYLSAEI